MTTPNATGIAMGASVAPINSSFLPNPFTPMAFLPPDVARQVVVSVYVLVGTTSILIWDVLCHLKDDYRLLTQYRINFTMVVYFVARSFNLLYLIGYIIVNSAPIGNCSVVMRVIQSFFPIAIPASEMLFFLHVRAVYIHNRPAVWLFTFLWLCTIASSLTPVISSTYMAIAFTEYCIPNGSLPSYATAAAVVPLVNDSVLFCALALRMLRSSYHERTLRGDIKSMVFGDHIPLVSRALLQNGQAYFLSTVFLNLITVIMYYINSLPAAYRAILGFPSILLMNVMASRIYRNTKFGRFSSSPTWPVPSSSAAYGHRGGYLRTGTMVAPHVSVVTTQSRDLESSTIIRDSQSMSDGASTSSDLREKFDLEAGRLSNTSDNVK
ncbi:hypothetical protein D9619_009093 [Psilocybe cf. subviscida]|uniref:Uncharacterized protein n=1 Tax=Psilocybe cf. subviscida TaxID=2480587 RepID=A0A8H5FAJ0_9AGAR|nr:hypothetical protein D9619_009093 [Psilocybe cf. subviscida]